MKLVSWIKTISAPNSCDLLIFCCGGDIRQKCCSRLIPTAPGFINISVFFQKGLTRTIFKYRYCLTINLGHSSMKSRKCVAEGTLCCGGDMVPYCSLGGRVEFSRLINQFYQHILKPSDHRKRIELIAHPRKKHQSVEVRCGGDTFLEQQFGYPKNEHITPL